MAPAPRFDRHGRPRRTDRPFGRPHALGRDVQSGEPLFLADVGSRSDLDKALWQRHGAPASMLFQPVLRGGAPVGVLVIGWAERTPAGRRAAIISLLAAEAAFAIDTADLVERLTDLASVDSLTGRAEPPRLGRPGPAACSPDRGNQPVCVALLDLDHFKAFNDSRGHQAGDRLLKEAAAGWRDSLRAGDVLARYGGEEFAVLLPACDARPTRRRRRPPARAPCPASRPARPASRSGTAASTPTRSCAAPTRRSTRPRPSGRDRTTVAA